MKYYYKFYEWVNGTYGKDWTHHVSAPIFVEERLNEELDTAQVNLVVVPIAFKKPFSPKTKFRLERFTNNPNEDIANDNRLTTQYYWDYVLDKDEVEHNDDNTLCTHRLHLIEPSVVSQGMLVDNIALTYELQDVTLDYRTTISKEDSVFVVINGGNNNNPIGELVPQRVSEDWKYTNG